jgi:hypothetical protein
MHLKQNIFARQIFAFAGLLIPIMMTGCGNETNTNNAKLSATAGKTDTPSVTLSPAIPADVVLPQTDIPPIVFFNDYSWKIFIALTWPAKQDARGVADTSKKITDKGPRVFATYKTVSEVFQPDASAPSDWNVFDDRNPARIKPRFGELILGSYNHLDFLAQAGFNALTGPVATQNNKYTMVLTAYNESEFNEIKGKKWYLKQNLHSGLAFQTGAIDIKMAWMDMEGLSDEKKARYYTDSAWVMNQDPSGDFKYQRKLVGLVGLHIVQKTPTRPQWIWSSFEQVDNLPGEEGAAAPYNYYKDGADAPPANNPNKLSPLTWPEKFYNVKRVKPVNDFTKATNQRYQQALKKEGSVWQYYKLVVTQWPTPANSNLDGSSKNTIPGAKNGDRPASDSTSFANITMETYQQSKISQGCMNCHNVVRDTADFLWTMFNHAGPKPEVPAIPPSLKKSMKAEQPHESRQTRQLDSLLIN